MDVDSFRFSPELFELRSEAFEALAAADIDYMVDFQGIDVLHDNFGLEVFGIPNEETATKILPVIINTLIGWQKIRGESKQKVFRRCFDCYSGWKAEVFRYWESPSESWNVDDD